MSRSPRVVVCLISPTRGGMNSPERLRCATARFAGAARRTSNDWRIASGIGSGIAGNRTLSLETFGRPDGGDPSGAWRPCAERKGDDYLDARGLRKNALFLQLLQALIELAGEGTDERVILENLSNHLAGRGIAPKLAPSSPACDPRPR